MPRDLTKPLLIYDGDCGFCRRWIERWRRLTGDRVDYAPYQAVALDFPEIPRAQFQRSVQLIESDGTVTSGAHAVFKARAYAKGGALPLWMYRHWPGFAPLAELAYAFVAGNRRLFSALTTLLWGEDLDPPRYALTRWLFLRGVGVIYLIAFVSLWVQVDGLIGSQGILPADEFLQAVKSQIGIERFWLVPTLAWFNSSDVFLHVLCALGTACSLLVILNLAPAMCLLLNWAIYLSLLHVGQDFLSFQWDILLLETGFLAVFFAPWKWNPRLGREGEPSRLMLFLLRWLLFRLMFLSGWGKLASGDATWHNLTALTFHYETQPLPTPLSWYIHQLPVWFHQFSVVVMFAVELFIPFLIFLPRRPRLWAFWALIFLQLVIIATGNYTFFNWLTIVLCLLVLDDRHLLRLFLKRFRAEESSSQPTATARRVMSWAVAAVILAVSCAQMANIVLYGRRASVIARPLLRMVAPFHSVNTYGLFTVMTTRRPEIIVEGSDDGQTWLPYEFKYKPGDPSRRPPMVAPHQPRLDWQMWFAALGDYRQNPWFARFLQRLLEGSPAVLDLLGRNPLPDHPPRYVRAMLYEYRFTDVVTRPRDGHWWERREIGVYAPAVSLRPHP